MASSSSSSSSSSPSPSPSPGSPDPVFDPSYELSVLVKSYEQSGDVGRLLDQVKAYAARTSPEVLLHVARPYSAMPEVTIPIYERIVAARTDDAQAHVVLANSYWLVGRGPEPVERLAERAKTLDPENRGAWHLWALAQSNLRKRVDRWLEVTRRFPADQLARAALADNAVSLANDEHDAVALKLAIETYETLLAEATQTAQRLALEETLKTLKRWNF